MTAHPLEEKWWRDDAQYQRSLRHGVTMDQVDSAMQRVAEVFNTDWCSTNSHHLVYFQINSRGLNPFQFLSDLGMDLISVATCRRHKRLIEDLKQTETFSSAFLELFIAAKLQHHGHCVELRPELPNGKNADLLTKEDGLGVYFEIKQLDRSDAHKAVEQLSLALLFAMTDLQRLGVWPEDHGYEIAISEKTLQSLDSGGDADQVFIAEIVEAVITELKTRLASSRQMPFAFDVRNYLNVRVGRGITSQLSGPVLAPEPELTRVLRKHFKRPNEQLHPQCPGILLIQSAAALDPVFTRIMVAKLLEERQPVHLSVVIFVSVLPPESMSYVFFPAFAVANPRARFPAQDLKVFQTLCDIFRIVESS